MPDNSTPNESETGPVDSAAHSGTVPDSPKSQTTHEPQSTPVKTDDVTARPPEFGGPKGLEPTRFGDWEKNGRCTDF